MGIDPSLQAVFWLYVANATLIILHEVESAYWKVWEILKLPGRITGFLLLHVPVFALLVAGAGMIAVGSIVGLWLAVVVGIGGTVPLIIHGFAVRIRNRFNLIVTFAVLWTHSLAAAALVVTALLSIFR